jgi:hypothetical protein
LCWRRPNNVFRGIGLDFEKLSQVQSSRTENSVVLESKVDNPPVHPEVTAGPSSGLVAPAEVNDGAPRNAVRTIRETSLRWRQEKCDETNKELAKPAQTTEIKNRDRTD